MIEIDGTLGEGGGQLLRSALTLSVITGHPFRITRIRARRKRPGLAHQHHMAVLAATNISGARVEGDVLRSQELRFEPGQVLPGEYRFDIGTAGSSSLVLQTILLPLALASGPSRVTITGGTHVPMSPCFHYLDWQWRTGLAALGVDFSLVLERAGFYPPGGGAIRAEIPGMADIRGLDRRERGRLLEIHGLSSIANLPLHIAERQRDRALYLLRHLDCPIGIGMEQTDAASPGSFIALLARFEHGQACCFALGARGRRAEQVGEDAAHELLAVLATDGVMDRWLADQLIVPLAIAAEPSAFRTPEVTLHLVTQAELVGMFLPVEVRIDAAVGKPGLVTVTPRTMSA